MSKLEKFNYFKGLTDDEIIKQLNYNIERMVKADKVFVSNKYTTEELETFLPAYYDVIENISLLELVTWGKSRRLQVKTKEIINNIEWVELNIMDI